jgi:hypothetical protein
MLKLSTNYKPFRRKFTLSQNMDITERDGSREEFVAHLYHATKPTLVKVYKCMQRE